MNSMEISLQSAERKVLSNGVRLYILNSEEFEVLRVSFIFRAGSVVQSHPFLASATSNMLCEGSATMNSREIAEKLDFYGSYYDVNIDRDYVYINFCSLSKFVAPTLEVAEQIINYPTFPEDELSTYCAKRRQRLEIERQKVETKAREEFAKSIFGAEHPYGVSYHESEYDSLTRDMMVDFYNQFYCAENMFMVCSGRVGDEELAHIERIASSIRSGGQMATVNFGAVEQRANHFVDCPEALQSSIRIGRRLFTRNHPDFLGMQVVATALGGYFGSRLMQTLREQRGYTYGVVAAMVNFSDEGYMAIATQVGTEVTQDALALIWEQIELLRTETMSDQELDMVKNIMMGETMRILDGPFGVADVTIENILCESDNSIVERNMQKIMEFTPNQIRELAHKYLDRESMIAVVAGSSNPF